MAKIKDSEQGTTVSGRKSTIKEKTDEKETAEKKTIAKKTGRKTKKASVAEKEEQKTPASEENTTADHSTSENGVEQIKSLAQKKKTIKSVEMPETAGKKKTMGEKPIVQKLLEEAEEHKENENRSMEREVFTAAENTLVADLSEEQSRSAHVLQYSKEEYQELVSGENSNTAEGILEILPDGFGFLRGENYQSTENDIYLSPTQIRRFNMKTGDRVLGVVREPKNNEKFRAIIYVKSVNGMSLEHAIRRKDFDRLVPVYPMERLVMENGRDNLAPRIIDFLSPIGKGQRGMIVAPPRAGKTSILKNIANSIRKNNPEVELMILLVDERPEEVTDIRESVDCDVIASTFDQDPTNHIKVTEMVLARAKGLVEMGKDVVILMDSLTRLARAYNLTINPTGRSLSGGLDPGALYGPKNFFGAARNIREGGSLTIIATALVETGSRMDDVIFEEFKGTGNMELVLDRRLAERRVYPAIDIHKSATRKEELLLTEKQLETIVAFRRSLGQRQLAEGMEEMISALKKTKNNEQFIEVMGKLLER